jgi:hypothetical protein
VDPSEKSTDKSPEYEAELEKLYAEIGRLTTQLSWLKKKSGEQHE